MDRRNVAPSLCRVHLQYSTSDITILEVMLWGVFPECTRPIQLRLITTNHSGVGYRSDDIGSLCTRSYVCSVRVEHACYHGLNTRM
jgi:hypothetical protein